MSHYGLNGRFLLNKIPVWNFGNSTCPMERYCDSGCTDPTQTIARLVIVLVRSIQKCGTEEIWGEQFGQMERDISFRPTKMTTGQSGPCTFKFRSNQTEMVHSTGCTNRNFRNFGLNGKLPTEPGHWITGNAFQISLHPIGILAMAFWTFQSWSFLNVGKHFTTQNTFSALFRWRTWPEVYFRLWHKLQSCSLSGFKDSMKFQIFGTKKGACNQ